MINIENEVFNILSASLKAEYPDIYVSGEDMVNAPSSFPCVSIVEADNYMNVRTIDSGSNENHVRVMYEINVYSNKVQGKKLEANKVFEIVDNTLSGLGLIRTSKNPFTINTGLYRIVARYEGIVSKDRTIYRG